MSRRASATVVLVAMTAGSLVADVAATHGWMTEKHRNEWGMLGSMAALIWIVTMLKGDA